LNGAVEVADQRWPTAHGGPPLSGVLRAQPDHFQVRELMSQVPTGEGEHLWVRIKKTGCNTDWVADLLAKQCGVARKAVSYSGRKDRHAVTEQWFSVHGVAELATGELAAGVVVLETARHRRKLRLGTHNGNEFTLTLSELSGDRAAAEGRLADISARGVPNYFGEQRFGRNGGNLVLAGQLFEGRRLPRAKRSLALSAARSYLFNLVVGSRVTDGCWDRLVVGDLANLDGSGSVFAVDSITPELETRIADFDIHPSAPLVGRGGVAPTAACLALEQAALVGQEQLMQGLTDQGVTAMRRATRCRLEGLAWQWLDARALQLSFTLQPGVFATSAVRELMRVS
jgi:tRNA pseudouridine13 synthase